MENKANEVDFETRSISDIANAVQNNIERLNEDVLDLSIIADKLFGIQLSKVEDKVDKSKPNDCFVEAYNSQQMALQELIMRFEAVMHRFTEGI